MKIVKRSTKGAAKHAKVKRAEHEAIGAAGGAATGALVGSVAGPPGIVVGGIVGGVIGALAAVGMELGNDDSEATSKRLDAEIGVSGGDMGAPNLRHPPERR